MSDRPTQMAGWLVDQFRALSEQSHQQAESYRAEANGPGHWITRMQAEQMAQWCDGGAKAYAHAAEMMVKQYGIRVESAADAEAEAET